MLLAWCEQTETFGVFTTFCWPIPLCQVQSNITLVMCPATHAHQEKFRKVRTTNEKMAPFFNLPGILAWHFHATMSREKPDWCMVCMVYLAMSIPSNILIFKIVQEHLRAFLLRHHVHTCCLHTVTAWWLRSDVGTHCCLLLWFYHHNMTPVSYVKTCCL